MVYRHRTPAVFFDLHREKASSRSPYDPWVPSWNVSSVQQEQPWTTTVNTMAGRNTCTLLHKRIRASLSRSRILCHSLPTSGTESPMGTSRNMLAEYIGYSWVWCLQCRSHNSPVNSLGLLHLQGLDADIMWESRLAWVFGWIDRQFRNFNFGRSRVRTEILTNSWRWNFVFAIRWWIMKWTCWFDESTILIIIKNLEHS